MAKIEYDWFQIDKSGFAELMTRRGLHVLIVELIQNAWDEDVKRVEVKLEPVPYQPYVEVFVKDDAPDGFANLKDAYTLFGATAKRRSPDKRGRFNLGEKAVLACCTKARVGSTKGTIVFGVDGNRKRQTGKGKKTRKGSIFRGTMRMTRAQMDDALNLLGTLIPPAGVVTTINGEELPQRTPLASFGAKLLTESTKSNGDGIAGLSRYERNTTVNVYEVPLSEEPHLYEMGIPVVPLEGYPWHVDVQQRCPVNVDRDNVPPSFLKALGGYLAEHMHGRMDDEQASASWAAEALEDERCSRDAADDLLAKRFGKRRVSFDPSDPEANKIAASKGYTVVCGGSLSKEAWQRVRDDELMLPAGKVTPSPKVLSSPDGDPGIPQEKWSDGMRRVAEYAWALARLLIDNRMDIEVKFVNQRTEKYNAFYGQGQLGFNIAKLGRKWFEEMSWKTNRLILHEFAHHFEADHLSSNFHNAIAKLGAKLADLALRKPSFFLEYGFEV